MKKCFKKIPVVAFPLLLPFAVFAQTLEEVFERISDFLNQLIPFLVLLATVLFLWGIVKYLTAGGNEERTAEARKMILWGIIFLAVMIAVWGFVNLLLDFIFGTTEPEPIPQGPNQP